MANSRKCFKSNSNDGGLTEFFAFACLFAEQLEFFECEGECIALGSRFQRRMKHYQYNFAVCHQKPERSFFWKGKQFPVCARCTGLHIGYCVFPFFLFGIFALNIWLTVILILPTWIDGLTQAFMKRESSNLLRVTTGLLAGIGIMSLLSIGGKFVGDQILNIIK